MKIKFVFNLHYLIEHTFVKVSREFISWLIRVYVYQILWDIRGMWYVINIKYKI